MTFKQNSVNICKVFQLRVKALQQIGRFKRELFTGDVIGITGSNGKTIVKEWLYTILSSKFSCIKSPKSYNSQIAFLSSLWLLQNSFEKGIIEAGISRSGEMAILEELIQPEIGIFTNIGSAHGENFETIEQKLKKKTNLFSRSKKVICSSSDERIVDALKSLNGPEIITWGENSSDQYKFRFSQNKMSVQYNDDHKFEFQIPADRFIYSENLCHVIVMAFEPGLNLVMKFSMDLR